MDAHTNTLKIIGTHTPVARAHRHCRRSLPVATVHPIHSAAGPACMHTRSFQKTLKTVLDILDSCNKAAISMAVQIILEKFLFYSRDNNNIINGVNADSLQRRSSIILQKKLNEVLQTGRESMGSNEVHRLLPPPIFDRIVEIFNGQQENKT